MGKLVTNNNNRIFTKKDIVVSEGPSLYTNNFYNYKYVCPFITSSRLPDGTITISLNVCCCSSNYFEVIANFFNRAIPNYYIIRNNISFNQYECIRDDKSIAIRTPTLSSTLLISITLPSDGGGYLYSNAELSPTTLYVYTRIHNYLMYNHASRSPSDFLTDAGSPGTTSPNGAWNIAPFDNATSFAGSDFDFYYTFKLADQGETITLLIELPSISGYYNEFLVYFENREGPSDGYGGSITLNGGNINYSSSGAPIFHKINITTTDNLTDPNYEIISSGSGMIFYMDGNEANPLEKTNDSIYYCGNANINLGANFFS